MCRNTNKRCLSICKQDLLLSLAFKEATLILSTVIWWTSSCSQINLMHLLNESICVLAQNLDILHCFKTDSWSYHYLSELETRTGCRIHPIHNCWYKEVSSCFCYRWRFQTKLASNHLSSSLSLPGWIAMGSGSLQVASAEKMHSELGSFNLLSHV